MIMIMIMIIIMIMIYDYDYYIIGVHQSNMLVYSCFENTPALPAHSLMFKTFTESMFIT